MARGVLGRWKLDPKNRGKMEFGAKRSNSGRIGAHKDRFVEKKYPPPPPYPSPPPFPTRPHPPPPPPPPKIVFNLQKVKKRRSKQWRICITQYKREYPPWELPSLTLWELAGDVTPVLTYIFSQSLTTGDLPLDWLKASVAPIFWWRITGQCHSHVCAIKF